MKSMCSCTDIVTGLILISWFEYILQNSEFYITFIYVNLSIKLVTFYVLKLLHSQMIYLLRV